MKYDKMCTKDAYDTVVTENIKKEKKVRRFSVADIIQRRIQYMCYVFYGKDIYDLEQKVLKEYEICLKLLSFKEEIGGKFIISRIAVSVTNQCSLQCRDCNNLMPYCKEKFWMNVNEQKHDLEKLLFYIDGIINVEVIGGEPFVYKQLPALLEYLCNEPKIKFVEITTNGTIFPSEKILELLEHPKICVLLSDYGKINRMQVNKLYQYLRQKNIHVQNLKNRKWIQGGDIKKRKKSRMRMKYEYFHCFARKDCRTLYRGNLYVCGRAPILSELGILSENSSYLDIRKLNKNRSIGRKKILAFFKNNYAESCNYCDCASDFSYWIESGIQK